MRDIRRDLEDRIALVKEQADAADTEFERKINKVKQEHEGKLRELTAELDAVKTLMEVEQRRFGSSPPQSPEPSPQREQPKQAQAKPQLLDILIHKLRDDGPASCDDLRHWAIQQGYLEESNAAGAALDRALTDTAKAGLIRQLPDGKLAATSITDLIRQRTI